MNDLLQLMHDTMGKTANIKGAVNLLRKECDLNDDGKKYVDIIERQANALNEVLDLYYKQNKKTMNIDIEKAINFLLLQQYKSEFEVIEKLNQHPSGLNFEDWKIENKLVQR